MMLTMIAAEVLVWYLLLKPDIKSAPDDEMVIGPPFDTQQECNEEKKKIIEGLKARIVPREEWDLVDKSVRCIPGTK